MLPVWLTTTPIAHRGLHDGEDIIENTKTAFLEAVTLGYAIEIDLRLTADNEVIVLHDSNMSRVAGVDMKVAKTNYADIAKHTITGSKDSVLRLVDFLNLISGRVPLLIEFKTTDRYKALCDETMKILNNYKGEYALQAFNPFVVNYLNVKLGKDRKVALGILSPSYNKMPPFIRGGLKNFKFLNFTPDFLAQNCYLLDTKQTSILRDKGVPVITWTVTTDKELEMVKGKAVNIIFEKIRP